MALLVMLFWSVNWRSSLKVFDLSVIEFLLVVYPNLLIYEYFDVQ